MADPARRDPEDFPAQEQADRAQERADSPQVWLRREACDPAALERFWAKVLVGDEDECWTWQERTNPKGYGRFSVRRVPGKWTDVYAHRFAYEVCVGPIPEGLTIDHLCRNRACVNPAHLEAVTNRENVLRGNSPTAVHARQTHCHRGHPLEGDNLYWTRDGRRQCRTCRQYREQIRLERERQRRLWLGPTKPCSECGYLVREVEPGRWICPCQEWSKAAA